MVIITVLSFHLVPFRDPIANNTFQTIISMKVNLLKIMKTVLVSKIVKYYAKI